MGTHQYGRNKDDCKVYKNEGKRERNKARKLARIAKHQSGTSRAERRAHLQNIHNGFLQDSDDE